MENIYLFMDLEYNQILRSGENTYEISPFTGDVLNNEITQISVIPADDKMRITGVFLEYISPKYNKVVPRRNKRITGIGHKELRKKGKDFNLVFNKLRKFICNRKGDSKTLFFITWGDSDKYVLKNNLEAYGIDFNVNEYQWIDLQVAFCNRYNLYDNVTNAMHPPKLYDAGIMCGVAHEYETLHDAKSDAELTMKIADKLGMEYVINNHMKRYRIYTNTRGHLSVVYDTENNEDIVYVNEKMYDVSDGDFEFLLYEYDGMLEKYYQKFKKSWEFKKQTTSQ